MNQRQRHAQQAAQGKHHLLGRFDYDPGRWRPLYYGVKISVGTAINANGIGSIPLNNQPYILTRVMHKIVGETADPATTGLYQDGQYDVALRDEQSNYQNGFIGADLMYGSIGIDNGSGGGGGFVMDLTYPLPFAGSKTITWEVINRVPRTLASAAETFTVEICLHGLADWGTTSP